MQDCATKTLKAIGKETSGLYHLLEVPVTRLDTEVIALGNKLLNNAVDNCVDMPKSILITLASDQKNDLFLWH